MRHGLPLVLLLCTAAGCSRYPTAPSAAVGGAALGGALATEDGAVPGALRSVTGRATNALTGAGAAGVTVRAAGLGEAVADAAGNFTLGSEAVDGLYRLTVSGAGMIERQTSLMFPGEPVALSLMLATFNTQAFNLFARSYAQPDVLERWVVAPALIIETSLLDRAVSIGAMGLPMDTLVASADQQGEAAVHELVAQLTRALPLLTGGRFAAFSGVSAQTTAAGAPVETLSLGAITVVRYARGAGPCRGFGQVAPNSEFVVVAARVGLEVCIDALAAPVAAHELGHALGFGHVSGAASVMTTVVTGDVTEFDRQAGAVAYQRAPGNRAPDVDPETFTVNQPLPAPPAPAAAPLALAPALP